MQKIAVIALLVACLAVAAQAANSTHSTHHKSHKYTFRVTMVGNHTKASGKITATADLDKQTVTGAMFVKNLANMTMAHFHVGKAGEDGPVAAWIAPLPAKKPLSPPVSIGPKGLTIKFVIKAKDIISNPAVNVTNFKTFIAAVKAHRIYANVHTTQKPAGEIRGQTH